MSPRGSRAAIADVRAYVTTMDTGEVLGSMQCVMSNLAHTLGDPTPSTIPPLDAAGARIAHVSWMCLVLNELHRRLAQTTCTIPDHAQCTDSMAALNIVTFRDILGVDLPAGWPGSGGT